MLNLRKVMASLLKELHADLKAQDHLGRTPLFYAPSDYGIWYDGDVLHQLLDIPGIDIDGVLADNTSILRKQVGMYLEGKGIEPTRIPSGLTPLHLAAILSIDYLCKTQLKNPDVELNAHDSCGRTPLWYAAGGHHPKCLELLLAVPGVDLSLTSHSGDIPKCQSPDFEDRLVMIAEKRRLVESEREYREGRKDLSVLKKVFVSTKRKMKGVQMAVRKGSAIGYR